MSTQSQVGIQPEEKVKNRIASGQPGTLLLLSGNEAIARGAIEAGVRVATGYPGTPSSEILETLLEAAKDLGFYAEWSVNEKVAFEMAAGASLTGMRAMSSMKNAGLNVALDLFMTLPYGGVRGGLVVVVADDPAPFYSSNAQDSRFAAQWASVPCLEPEDQNEAKEMVKEAFLLSERIELPVLVRSVARLSHSSGVVELGGVDTSGLVQGFNKHWKLAYRWGVYGPAGGGSEDVMHAVREQFQNADPPSLEATSGWKHAWLTAQMPYVRKEADTSRFNGLVPGREPMGVVASGVGAAYVREAMRDLGLEGRLWFWKIGVVFPLPQSDAQKVLSRCKRLIVVEDGEPLVESQLRVLAQVKGIEVEIVGKMGDAVLTPIGELKFEMVRNSISRFAGIPVAEDVSRVQVKEGVAKDVTPRSSTLCSGCPHLGTYWALRRALKRGSRYVPIVNVDIGCYEQAGYGMQPYPSMSEAVSQHYPNRVLYNFLDTCYVMGSSVSMALGQAVAGYRDGEIVAVAGDSTFFHACLPALTNAVWNGIKLTFVVVDNGWTAMTGFQPCPVSGRTGLGRPARVISIEEVATALGAGFVEVTDPYELEKTQAILRQALDFPGVAVVISRAECRLQVVRRMGIGAIATVDRAGCNGCTLCVQLGCPAVTFADRKAGIDPLLCNGCGLCKQVCPSNAIA